VQNIFPFAPKDLTSSGGRDPNKTATIIEGAGNPAGSAFAGRYFKMTQWKDQANRALLFDGTHNGGYWTAHLSAWPYAPDTATPMPDAPDYSWPIDFNRHGRKPRGNKPTDRSMNMLFCDGHAATVSAREAYKAIRFK
jgi:prepilin-type processing-associated H-X9-DG protein